VENQNRVVNFAGLIVVRLAERRIMNAKLGQGLAIAETIIFKRCIVLFGERVLLISERLD
jgi:hypothetical protein